MKSLRTERCHVGLSREFVGTACCTYGQSNRTIVLVSDWPCCDVGTQIMLFRQISHHEFPFRASFFNPHFFQMLYHMSNDISTHGF